MNRVCYLLVLLVVQSTFAYAQSIDAIKAEETKITTAEILESFSFDQSCLNYCFTGVCFWLKCSLVHCEIRTSIKVRHNNPDLVVSVYDESGKNPWDLAEDIYSDIEESLSESTIGLFFDGLAGGGHRVEGGQLGVDQSLRFKESTAIGHPLASFTDSFDGYYCPSEAETLNPYFSSSLDALTWRLGLPEMLYVTNLLPGQRVVGSGIEQQWGAVWPRTGFLLQKDDVKTAAVIAQRVGNIVTQTGQPHIYNALNGNGYNRTWLPGELIENDKTTGVWQMLAPKQDDQCYVFGENDVYNEAWSTDRTTEDNGYAFALWRQYECCRARGAFLFSVDVEVCI